MSGHSKWSTIKRKKSAQDAKRGKIFTKLIREITVAARMGGGDPSGNPRLRAAIASARAVNMPKDNIERAIKKGTGELAGYTLEEAIYEGYGPGGVAILIEALTDNRNRTTAELRYILNKHGGSLGEAGCVAWMFEKKGLIVFNRDEVDEDEIMEIALEAGAEDIREEDDQLEVVTLQADFEEVKKAFDEQNIKYELAEISMIPQNTVKLDNKQAEQMIKLMDALEDSDDVQKVYANFDIDEKILESLG